MAIDPVRHCTYCQARKRVRFLESLKSARKTCRQRDPAPRTKQDAAAPAASVCMQPAIVHLGSSPLVLTACKSSQSRVQSHPAAPQHIIVNRLQTMPQIHPLVQALMEAMTALHWPVPLPLQVRLPNFSGYAPMQIALCNAVSIACTAVHAMSDFTALFAEIAHVSGQEQEVKCLHRMSNRTLKFDVSVCQIPSSQAELLDSLPGTHRPAVSTAHLHYLTRQCMSVQAGSLRTLLSM